MILSVLPVPTTVATMLLLAPPAVTAVKLLPVPNKLMFKLAVLPVCVTEILLLALVAEPSLLLLITAVALLPVTE